jgi:hypothetical protein
MAFNNFFFHYHTFDSYFSIPLSFTVKSIAQQTNMKAFSFYIHTKRCGEDNEQPKVEKHGAKARNIFVEIPFKLFLYSRSISL